MTVSYIPAEIKNYTYGYISAIRWLIADTNTETAFVSDQELIALLDAVSSSLSDKQRVYIAALEAAKKIYRDLLQQVTYSSAGTSESLSDLSKQYAQIVTSLESSIATQFGMTRVIYPSRSYIDW